MAPATATAAAPRRSVRTAPAPEVETRPDLRVVDGIDDAPPRRSLGGLVGSVAVVLLFACFFGVVVFQVLLVQTQSHLDDLDRTLTTQEARAKALDLQTADLESPERIVAAAQERGMIAPADIVYLDPADDDPSKAVYDPATEPVGTTATTVADPAAATAGAPPAGGTATTTAGAATATTPTTGAATTGTTGGGSTAPGPPYTAENNWGAGGPTTVPPVYNAENNWGAGTTTAPAGAR